MPLGKFSFLDWCYRMYSTLTCGSAITNNYYSYAYGQLSNEYLKLWSIGCAELAKLILQLTGTRRTISQDMILTVSTCNLQLYRKIETRLSISHAHILTRLYICFTHLQVVIKRNMHKHQLILLYKGFKVQYFEILQDIQQLYYQLPNVYVESMFKTFVAMMAYRPSCVIGYMDIS